MDQSYWMIELHCRMLILLEGSRWWKLQSRRWRRYAPVWCRARTCWQWRRVMQRWTVNLGRRDSPAAATRTLAENDLPRTTDWASAILRDYPGPDLRQREHRPELCDHAAAQLPSNRRRRQSGAVGWGDSEQPRQQFSLGICGMGEVCCNRIKFLSTVLCRNTSTILAGSRRISAPPWSKWGISNH